MPNVLWVVPNFLRIMVPPSLHDGFSLDAAPSHDEWNCFFAIHRGRVSILWSSVDYCSHVNFQSGGCSLLLPIPATVPWTIIDPASRGINYHLPWEPNFKQSDEELRPSPGRFRHTAADPSITTLGWMPASFTPADDNPSAFSATAAYRKSRRSSGLQSRPWNGPR